MPCFTCGHTQDQAEHFRTQVFPLSVVEARCECGLLLDTGLRKRAAAPERTLAKGGPSHSEVQHQEDFRMRLFLVLHFGLFLSTPI